MSRRIKTYTKLSVYVVVFERKKHVASILSLGVRYGRKTRPHYFRGENETIKKWYLFPDLEGARPNT